jgi:hypothetical protein
MMAISMYITNVVCTFSTCKLSGWDIFLEDKRKRARILSAKKKQIIVITATETKDFIIRHLNSSRWSKKGISKSAGFFFSIIKNAP